MHCIANFLPIFHHPSGFSLLRVHDCFSFVLLYLQALKGDAILLRCQKSWSLLEVSLSQIQNMVPVLLAAEVGISLKIDVIFFCGSL